MLGKPEYQRSVRAATIGAARRPSSSMRPSGRIAFGFGGLTQAGKRLSSQSLLCAACGSDNRNMTEWNIQSRAHACAACGKSFADQETYHTLLFDEKADFRRSDIC